MIVECPSCATRYKLDPGRLSGAGARLKCARCGNVFPPPTPRKSGVGTPARKTTTAQEESLELPFDGTVWRGDEDEQPVPESAQHEPDDGFVLGAETPTTPVFETSADDSDSFAEDEPEPEPHDLAASLPTYRVRRKRSPESERGKLGTLLVFMLLVLGGYGILTLSLFSRPERTDRWFGEVPLIKAAVRDYALSRSVLLDNVSGSYQQIRDGKEVFVVAGQALNASREPLGAVQVAGSLYGVDGKLLAEKTIYCGNVISTRVLKGLSRREVSILQELNPPRQFALDSGEASTFVIVFMDPPQGVAEFSARISAARRQA
jgi:predicted Zn finger-like uncharacterized protein